MRAGWGWEDRVGGAGEEWDVVDGIGFVLGDIFEGVWSGEIPGRAGRRVALGLLVYRMDWDKSIFVLMVYLQIYTFPP